MDQENKIMKIEVKLGMEDVVRFNRKLAYGKMSTKILMVIGIIMISYLPVLIAEKLSGEIVPISYFITALVPISYMIVLPLTIKYATKMSLKKSSVLNTIDTYKIGNEGIEIKTKNGTQFIKWNEFYSVVELEKDFYFYLAKKKSHVITKKSFENEAQIDEFKMILKNKMDNQILKLKKIKKA